MKNLDKLREFKKIVWEDIPDYGLYSDQLIKYLDENLLEFFPGFIDLSQNMINNYVKNEIIPRPVKRKYYRTHIAHIIVVLILKQTIQINTIKEGIRLQKKILDEKESFNEFMDILEKSLSGILDSFKPGSTFVYKGFTASEENISISFAIQSFCFQTITRQISQMDDIYGKEGL